MFLFVCCRCCCFKVACLVNSEDCLFSIHVCMVGSLGASKWSQATGWSCPCACVTTPGKTRASDQRGTIGHSGPRVHVAASGVCMGGETVVSMGTLEISLLCMCMATPGPGQSWPALGVSTCVFMYAGEMVCTRNWSGAMALGTNISRCQQLWRLGSTLHTWVYQQWTSMLLSKI